VQNIRNFSIIAHIDHGKSTLADRMLEVTGTIEKRKMRDQVLDQMDIERERGITIKMQPVRMVYHANRAELSEVPDYILNLIDTPGHIDFSYEVSRALTAVEGAILLVDASQGVQAQTLSVLAMAREQKLVIIPVINKIDLPHADVEGTKEEIMKLLDCSEDEILAVSGKTGEGVEKLLEEIVKRIPPPEPSNVSGFQSLVFDFSYDTHRGVILYVRIFSGSAERLDKLIFASSKRVFGALDVGIFVPTELSKSQLSEGEIGYIVTGIKEQGVARIGDTITGASHPAPSLPGFGRPDPVVWASVYPENQPARTTDAVQSGGDHFHLLRQSLERLSLSDSSLSFEEETSGTLGRGFRCGFLGMLHLEVVTERLKREFGMQLIVATPTITYYILDNKDKRYAVYSAVYFPDEGTYKKAYEPWVDVTIITPNTYLGSIQKLFFEHEVESGDMENLSSDRVRVVGAMPLRELMRGFFDELKSASSGYASLSYVKKEEREADIVRMDMLINDEKIVAFSRVVARRRVEKEAEVATDKLEELIPKQMIEVKIQARALGRIIAARRKSAMRKDVTDYLYGGDITRKMKLREKQKKGKKKMQARGTVQIPQEAYLKMSKI